MKRKLIILSLLFLSSCGLFTENHREVRYKLADGNEVKLYLYEEKYPLSEKVLEVNVNDYPLKGKNCEDKVLKNFSDEVWSEIVKQNNLSEVKSGKIHFIKQQKEAVPEYCNYVYSKKEAGEWSVN